jgi:ATP-dependent 26S proteasome regulatory subunit
MKKMHLDTDTKDQLGELAKNLSEKANGLSGAEIVLICREAGLLALSDKED